MIRRWSAAIAGVLLIALVVHLLVVAASPRVAMSVAAHRIEDRAGGANSWLHADRVTPTTQEVVRSSPDLAYSACVWDLSEGPIRISAPAWDDYYSLSLYDEASVNFFVANDRDAGDRGVDVVLATADQAERLGPAGDAHTVIAPSRTGIALLRYLAPTATAFERADSLRRSAMCGAP